ncbi:MAG TPA: DUF4373 domain-containing protein [Candidatus Coproplasma excrementipullorum]|nr:DUF4373 domain-containing protein [Candidatus Coproplasma excrementipullorum]
MGAPTKEGLDYFPFYVDLLDNDDLDDLRIEYGSIANDVYIALLTLLYRKKGYYIPYSTEQDRADCQRYIFKRVRGGKYSIKQDAIPKVIEALVAKGLFERDLYPEIITSERAQRVYYSATVERSPDSFNIIPKYWILSEATMRKLSKVHPYYKALHLMNKSDDKQNKSDDKPSMSDEKQVRVNNSKITPRNPPEGEKKKDYKAIFFEAYPRLQLGRKDDSKIDYKLLYVAFERSSFLKNGYFSMAWVLTNYDEIINGKFEDEDYISRQFEERNRWYEDRRLKAESAASKALSEAEKDDSFRKLDAEVRKLTVKVGLTAAVDEAAAAELEKELNAAIQKRDARLSELGLDIQVHYYCDRCKDTGYLPNGKPCDCYKEHNG